MDKLNSKEKILLYCSKLSSIRAKNRLPALQKIRKPTVSELEKPEFLFDLKIFMSPQSNQGPTIPYGITQRLTP